MALYGEASRILKLIERKSGSVKDLIFSSRFKNRRQLYALVIETLKHNRILQEILEATKIHSKERLLNEIYVAKTMLYDFLFGKGLSGSGDAEQALLRHSSIILSAKKKLKGEIKMAEQEDVLPRYVRVNTLKTTVETVVDHFVAEGFQLKVFDQLDNQGYLNCLKNLKESEFIVDTDIPELLVFPPKTDLHEDTFYTSGSIILQDKASCFPPIVLNPSEGSYIIDCCAAPGNKTSLMAARINNNGMIFAFDKSSKRMETLKSLCKKAGASCVEANIQDFLRVNPQDVRYRNVGYILVDPSCSGSGIVDRKEIFCEESGPSASRLRSLANFQAMILNHALSFPSAKRVVYSTCSVHKEENEEVVCEVLAKYKDVYRLVHILPQLGCRGDVHVFEDAVKCVRLNPGNYMTNGFFISCFERISEKTNCSKRKRRIGLGTEESNLSEFDTAVHTAGSCTRLKSEQQHALDAHQTFVENAASEDMQTRDVSKFAKPDHIFAKRGRKRRNCSVEKSKAFGTLHQNLLAKGSGKSFSNCAQSHSRTKKNKRQRHKRHKGIPVTWGSNDKTV